MRLDEVSFSGEGRTEVESEKFYFLLTLLGFLKVKTLRRCPVPCINKPREVKGETLVVIYVQSTPRSRKRKVSSRRFKGQTGQRNNSDLSS